MKYIKKIFESNKRIVVDDEHTNKKEVILEYLESCFVDYIDQGYKFTYYDGTNSGFCSSYSMEIKLSDVAGDFNKMAEIGRKITEISEDFEVNMKKVNIEYPNFTYYYSVGGDPDLAAYIEISIRK